MSAEVYRKYMNIINENSQTIKSLVPKAMKFLGGDTIKSIATKVKEITGGDFTPSKENAMKVAQAFGLDKMAQSQGGQSPNQVAEGLAGNWQGRLIQLAHLALFSAGVIGTQIADVRSERVLAMAVGFILLMVTETFWSSDKGSVGAMGRYGNQGLETDKGPVSNL
jgi:hypothetical protein